MAHREELIRQPAKYYDCPVGFEIQKETSHGEEVVIASVQSLVRRLDRFSPDDFDLLIVDESHHSASKTYREILNYFTPRLRLGFTATANRSDNVRLDDLYSKIIFERNLRWAIKEGYLTDIYCRRVNIGYDLSKVHTRNGDYAPGELEEAMDGTADAIAQAYRELATGATLIFAVSINQAEEISKRIPGSVVVTGKTKNRAQIIQDFTDGKIKCIVNVMVFTEGTDIPRVETIIVARPTQSSSLYQQVVGRGLRLYPGKKCLNLIDCVGVTGRASLCTAPSLLGMDMTNVPAKYQDDIEGDLFELPDKILAASDSPESWIRNVEIVDLWAKEMNYNTHDIAFFHQADGSLTVSVPSRTYKIPCPNALGQVKWRDGSVHSMQESIDRLYAILREDYNGDRMIWDLNQSKGWYKKPVTENQKKWITRRLKHFDADKINRGEASQIINRLKYKPQKAMVAI